VVGVVGDLAGTVPAVCMFIIADATRLRVITALAKTSSPAAACTVSTPAEW
jgi:hypothetical protein